MKNILLLLSAAGIIFAGEGCKGDTAFGAKPIGNRRNVLTSHTWKLVKLVETGQDVPLSQCQLDNIYVFDVSSTGYMDEGGSKCGVITPVDTTNTDDTTVIVSKSTIAEVDTLQYDSSGMRINFTWEVPGAQRELIIYDFGGSNHDYPMEFEEMDETHFIVRGSEKRNGKLIVFYKHFQAVQ